MSKEVGDIIRDAREWRDLSKKALADESGVDRTTIGHLEHGHREPSLRSLVMLSAVLGNHMLVDVINQVRKEVGA
jgi:Predicted transcriptional regulators